MTIANYPGEVLNRAIPDKSGIAPIDHILFTLPHVLLNGKYIVTNEKVPVIIPFNGSPIPGISGSFTIHPGNGVTADLSVVCTGVSRLNEWEDENEWPLTVCGTNDSTTMGANVSGLLIRPHIPWLAQGQGFHVFRISFGHSRQGSHEGARHSSIMPDLLFGIQRPD